MRFIFDASGWLLALGLCAGGPAAAGAAPSLHGPEIRTTRLAQLTGGYDPEGKPFLNNTVAWQVAGADLGANTEHQGKLYFFFGDVVPTGGGAWPPYDSDLIAYTDDANPEPKGFRLTPVVRENAFYPFTVHFPGGAPEGIQLLRNDTPTGAFSYGGKVYVFFAWHDLSKREHPFYSSLAVSPDPGRPSPFEWETNLSEKFSQVAPCVITNSDIPGLPSTNGDGLILFGQGPVPGGGAVSLAWVPLESRFGPRFSGMRYFAIGPDHSRRWTTNAAEAAPLFKTRWSWSSLSAGKIAATGQWIVLYQRTARPEAPEESIVARIASAPSDFLDDSEAGEIQLFNPVRDGAYRIVAGDGSVLNRGYMHREKSSFKDALDRLPPVIGGNGFAYGAYLVNRYTRWDPVTRTLTLYYLMSTGTPYQVQLMRSQLTFQN